ncbi:MAG: prepilin-type N-terminal cleavage/methylation domain-containing protein [Nitrospirae bacterium]|nr:prepilin-type N-terminal cleavage/methylation domain-containing protein [Nitrospirota bacterium]
MSAKGFTFLELAVVLFIVSLFTALAYPTFRSLSGSPASEGRRFASILRYLNSTAINRKVIYELRIDFTSKQLNYDSPEGVLHITLESLGFIYVSSRGSVKEGQLILPFGSMGLEEVLEANFTNGSETITVSYNPYSKRVKLDCDRGVVSHNAVDLRREGFAIP